jgi:hypothetical protein
MGMIRGKSKPGSAVDYKIVSQELDKELVKAANDMLKLFKTSQKEDIRIRAFRELVNYKKIVDDINDIDGTIALIDDLPKPGNVSQLKAANG